MSIFKSMKSKLMLIIENHCTSTFTFIVTVNRLCLGLENAIILKIALIFILLISFVAPDSLKSQTNKELINNKIEGSLKLTNDRNLFSEGTQVFFGDSLLENHAMDAVLSPDGKWLAVEERYSLVIIDTKQKKVIYTLPLTRIPELTKSMQRAMNTYSGIQWNKINENECISWSFVCGNPQKSYVIQVKWNGHSANVVHLFKYNALKPAETALPNELMIRRENGIYVLYVVLNGNNQLLKQNLETGDTIWQSPTGVAPYGLAYSNGKLYTTNWGGRVPESDDRDIAGVPWGNVRINPANAGTREGSVSVFDPSTGKLLREIIVGLHPNKIIASPDQKFVFLTNSNSDAVSVIRTDMDTVSETIPIRLQPEFNNFFGDSPNGLTISKDGRTLYVAAGMDNAIAQVKLGRMSATKSNQDKSKVEGFISTGYYPSSISIKDGKQLYITNIEAMGPNLPFRYDKNKSPAFNAHHAFASVSIIDIPSKRKLAQYSQNVIALNQLQRLKNTQLPPRPKIAPCPLPLRIGEPSVFKHVLYIIKENRTYDQVFGDMKQGNGDSLLCSFGENITPNAHQLAKNYLLLDNYMASGKCSAEGHQWTDASIVTDYIEKNMRAWFRSYPHVQTDALVYAPTGFLWDNARKHGVSVKIFGEACIPKFDSSLDWTDIYSQYLNNIKFEFKNITTLNTVEPVLCSSYPGYDSHKIPDVLRAKTFIEELNKYDKIQGDSLPQLMIMALPADHTAGMSPGFPTPRAMVADNDVALGQIIDAYTHSKFYKNSVIFVTEDDSQDGWDHVSAFRTVGLVVSPYSKLRKTISTPYNQPSMVRTIEQILGLPPMNIQDAIATPMWNCFNDKPELIPYQALPNQISLNEMNKPISKLKGTAHYFALKSMEPQFAGIDTGNDDLMNRIIWFATQGNRPYPSKFLGNKIDE